MGIPHLITTLHTYATHHQLSDESLVIDGPALAYHIHHICRKNGVAHASYGRLGAVAIEWLEELVRKGVAM